MTTENTIPGRQEKQPGSSKAEIVELAPDKWRALRAIKLISLEQEPIAFEDANEGRERYLARTEAEWRDILAGKMSGGREGETITLFAQYDNRYVGMVSAIIPKTDGKNIATIQHMYVDAVSYRGLGIGRQLITELLQRLNDRGDIQKAELAVAATQEAAKALYESLGFKVIRKVENGAKRGTEEYDEFEMELDLTK